MFGYFNQLKSYKKGQIFPVLIVIIVILIIASLITANIGKVSLDRLYCIQAADAGALAGISDFTCGYNKAYYAHIAMMAVSVLIQAYLLIPQCVNCYASRAIVALAAGTFNRRVYEWADAVVRGYSEAARKDAYYYAFINAGIDDKYKCISVFGGDPYTCVSYRDKPLVSESWEQWTGYKGAFSKWLHETTSVTGWENAPSLTYAWHDGSKTVTVSCQSSPPEDLGYQAWALTGIYCIVICIKYVCFCIPIPLPHAPVPFYAFLHSPSAKWVNITVKRSWTDKTKNLGFWSVRRPDTEATARARMTGGIGSGFDFNLN